MGLAKDYYKNMLNAEYKNAARYGHSLNIRYMNAHQHFFEKKISGLEAQESFGRYSYGSQEVAFNSLVALKNNKTPKNKIAIRHFFLDPKETTPVFDLLRFSITTQGTNQPENVHKKSDEKPFFKTSPIFVFGHPMYKDYAQDQLDIECEMSMDGRMSDVKPVKNIMSIFQKNQILKFDPNFKHCDIVLKTGVKDDWNLNTVCLFPMPTEQDVRIINPNNCHQVWQDGGWTDIKWDLSGGIENGNTRKIPRLSLEI